MNPTTGQSMLGEEIMQQRESLRCFFFASNKQWFFAELLTNWACQYHNSQSRDVLSSLERSKHHLRESKSSFFFALPSGRVFITCLHELEGLPSTHQTCFHYQIAPCIKWRWLMRCALAYFNVVKQTKVGLLLWHVVGTPFQTLECPIGRSSSRFQLSNFK